MSGAFGALDVRANDLRLRVDWQAAPAAAVAEDAISVELRASPSGDMRALLGPSVRVSCKRLRLDGIAMPSCAGGEIALGPRDAAAFSLGDEVDAASGARIWRLDAEPLNAGVGRIALDASGGEGTWRAQAKLRGVPLPRVAAVALRSAPVEVSTGAASGSVTLRGADGEAPRLGARLDLDGVAFSDAAGELAAEGLGGRVSVTGVRVGQTSSARFEVELARGVAFASPLLLDADEGAVRLSGRVRAGPRSIRLSDVEYSQARGPRAGGAAVVSLAPGASRLDAVVVRVPAQPLAPLFTNFVAPWLPGQLADELDVGGEVAVDVDWRRGPGPLDAGRGSSAAVRLTDARIERGAGYRLDGLDATLDWAAGGGARPSMLAWSGGRLRDFDLGPARLRLALGGDGLRLIDAARLPLLDGALDVSRLEAGLSADGPRFEFDAELAPLSLEAVTTAFGWPALPGKVAGSFRRLGFAAGALRLGGEMAVEVFDGRVRVTDLVIDDLFGTLPSVRANIGVRGLSLEPLTAAFDFGAISGRLDGRVENLYLQGSRAVTFDAWLATPPASDDDLPHRISQRAVDNLTSLGGASGTLATTFLGFFESFRYARLGLGCRLANGRCEMRGVADAPEGYYIVRGAGLPRVDVVGYNRSVDWDELVRRLSAAASAEAPVVR